MKQKFEIVPPKDRILFPGQKAKIKINPPPPTDEEKSKVTWRVVDHPEYKIGGSGIEVELDVPAGRPVGENVKVEATYAGLAKTVELQVGDAGVTKPSPPAPTSSLAIQAALGGSPLNRGDRVPSNSKISLVATGLTAEKAAAIRWAAKPEGLLTFQLGTGATTTATVADREGRVEIVAEHADAKTALFDLEVKAESG